MPKGRGTQLISLVEEVFPVLSVGIAAQSECPVIDETHTAEGLGEHVALVRRRIAAVQLTLYPDISGRFSEYAHGNPSR
jgi:hypothetical protein